MTGERKGKVRTMKKVKKLLTYLITATLLFSVVEPAVVLADDTAATAQVQDQTDNTADEKQDADAVDDTADGKDAADKDDAADTDDTADKEDVADKEDPADKDDTADKEDPADKDDAVDKDDTADVTDPAVDDTEDIVVPAQPIKTDEEKDLDADETDGPVKTAVTVTFDANGGSFADEEDASVKTLEVEYDSKLDAYPDVELENIKPEYKGYTLAGWAKEEDGKPAYAADEVITVSEDTALYAIWEEVLEADEYNEVTITLVANGGIFPDEASKKGTLSADKKTLTVKTDYGYMSLSSSYHPARDGYKLEGWSETAAGPMKYDTYIFSDFTRNTTLYAIWKPAYTITLNANGGVFPEDASYEGILSNNNTILKKSVESGYNVHLSTDHFPTLDGKILQGWSLTKGGSVDYSQNLQFEPESNMTMYAVWTVPVDVTFKAEDGLFPDKAAEEGTLDSSKKVLTVKGAVGGTVWLMSSYLPIKAGSALAGWTTVSGGPVQYNPSDNIEVTRSMTLYAVYVNKCKVTVHANGGAFPEYVSGWTVSSDRKTVTKEVAEGDKVRLSDGYLPANGKKSLIGWATSKKAREPDQGTSNEIEVRVYKNTDFYAVWDDTCTVTFKTDGSLYFQNGNDKYVKSIEAGVPKGSRLYGYTPAVYLKKGNEYERIDSSCLKWSTKKGTKDSKAFDASKYSINKNETIYPVQSEITIKWYANGGTIDGQTKVTTTVKYGGSVDTPGGEYVRAGYDLVGWGTKKNAKETDKINFSNVHATKKAKYYAIWTKKVNKITVKSDGGTFEYASNATISADKKTLTAYLEKGMPLSNLDFRYKKNGQTDYNPEYRLSRKKGGKPISNVYAYYPRSSMTLYMTDEAAEGDIPVIYDANGGTFNDGKTGRITYYRKGEVFLTPADTPTKDGHYFVGWFDKKKGGKEIVAGSYKIKKKKTVYAHWKKGVTVTFDANGGTFNISRTGEYKTKDSRVMQKGEKLDSIFNGYYEIPKTTDNKKGFIGWSTSRKGSVVDLSKINPTKNMTLYAQWGKGKILDDGRIDMTGKTYYYTGKDIKPKFKVYDRDGKKVSSSNYTVKYSDNRRAGTAFVTVVGKGKYTGMLRTSFYIGYNKTSKVKSMSGSKKKLKVTYSKAKGAAEYNVYAVNKDTGEYYCETSKKTSATFKNLKSGKYLFYVRPVAYGKNGQTNYPVESGKAGNVKQKQLK